MTLKSFWKLSLALLATTLLPTVSANGAETVLGHHPNDSAKAGFTFDNIAAPSSTDAGNLATVRLLAGQLDSNSPGPECLFDGKLPSDADQPNRNFFFSGGNGGRLLIDLGKDIDVKEIRSYSWHPDQRGPQVYEVFGASEQSGAKTSLRRRESALDNKWTSIAKVDTTGESKTPGGQYAASVRSSTEGESLGSYRYLLFEVSPTSNRSPFAETFFSEIDIEDGQSYELKLAEPRIDTLDIDGKYTIHFNTTETPDLQPWVQKELMPICKQWYPKIVGLLPSEGYDAPEELTVTFKAYMDGVAYAAGTQITAAGPWYRRQLEGEALGSIVHEMVHVVQQYGRARGRNRNPSWMVEGVADYVRWFLYEPPQNRPRVNPARANYNDSYRTTASFLDFAAKKYDPKLIEKFNASMREGRYSDDLWNKLTGKSPEEIWKEYVATLK
ncbi:basic secretory family protein [Stieleria sp. JC731]|uniref:basic secretory family protein n=1 Tax=Pirellulaceae TaxID=2691357 RepID=UPI001E376601|nr:basic secretory family protein [Stieleria sp. JC731]MCC9600894.1 basic secretory family protein [Stieleria sp. JC731]